MRTILIRTTKEDIEEWAGSGFCGDCPIKKSLERLGYLYSEVDCQNVTIVGEFYKHRVLLPEIAKSFVMEVDFYANGDRDKPPSPIEFEIPDPFSQENL